ncbi:hypothetical protein OH735_15915 [Streptomyces sp. NBC_01618]|nr:hypothetical protein OH735_15915 [Streptomyces sp. NBC_01618]
MPADAEDIVDSAYTRLGSLYDNGPDAFNTDSSGTNSWSVKKRDVAPTAFPAHRRIAAMPGPRRDTRGIVDAPELGYSDQAHLVRDFTATVGV